MDYKAMARTFLKNIPGVGPDQLKTVNLLFETKWSKPRFALPVDFLALDQAKPETVARVDGVRDGKKITILVHADDPAILTPELRAWLKGGN